VGRIEQKLVGRFTLHRNQHLYIRMSKKEETSVFVRGEKVSPLGGLSLGLVEPGEAAAVGGLGFSGLLRAQPGDLLHQRHVHQHRPPRHVPAWGDDRIRVGGTLASSQRRQRKGREGRRRRTEEDEGGDEGHGEEGTDEEDDGELQRRREAAARHGAGGSSVPRPCRGEDPIGKLSSL
jgi:hypothetical protein